MFSQYRISKYNPIYRNEQGHYKKNEWTETSDIGKIFDGKIFTIYEYLQVEEKYISTIIEVIKYNNIPIDLLSIEFLPNQADYFGKGNTGNILRYITPGQLIKGEYMLAEMLKLLLRYENWFRIEYEDFFITIGYDSYFHIGYYGRVKALKIPNLTENIYFEPFFYYEKMPRRMKYNPKTWKGWEKHMKKLDARHQKWLKNLDE